MLALILLFLYLAFVAFLVWDDWTPTPKSEYQLEIEAQTRKQETVHQMRDYAKAQRLRNK